MKQQKTLIIILCVICAILILSTFFTLYLAQMTRTRSTWTESPQSKMSSSSEVTQPVNEFGELERLAQGLASSTRGSVEGDDFTRQTLYYIEGNKERTEKYLNSHKDDPTKQTFFTEILQDYALLFLPGGYSLDGEIDSTSTPSSSIFSVLGEYHGIHPLTTGIAKRNDGTYILTVDLLYLSGAYNIVNEFYRISLENGSVKIVKLSPIWTDKEKLTIDSELDNAEYDEKTDTIKVYGMRPFGLYPCNDISTFAILADRLIMMTTEVKKACIGKDLSDPEKVLQLPETTDFSTTTLSYTTPKALFEKAKSVSTSSLKQESHF